MKKLIAILCAAAMLLLATVPALANPSIAELTISDVGSEIVAAATDNVSEATQEKLDSGDWKIDVVPVSEETIAQYPNADVREAVTAVNINQDAEDAVTVADVAEKLITDSTEEGVTEVKVANSETGKTVDLNDYDFVTGFIDVVLTDGDESVQSEADETLTVHVTMDIDQLKDVEAEDLGKYLLMLVNTDSGEVVLLELDENSFDSETGKITLELPFLGTIALIQNVSEE